MSLQAGIFDLDGVIVNTVQLHFNAWRRMFAEYGKDFTFQDYKDKVDGIPRIDGAKMILPDISGDELVKATDKKQVYFLDALEDEGVTIYDTTVKLVGELKAAGVNVAVISSSKNCKPILAKADLTELFDVIFTGHDVEPGRGKPYPDVFLSASNHLGFKPCDCVVFEDAVSGVEAAYAGGFKCVGIDRYNHPQRLAKADIVVKDLGEIDLVKLKELFK